MNRFAIAVAVVGLALSVGLASQRRDQFGGEGGSAPLVPEFDHLPGTTQRGGGSYRSPGTQGASFELVATQTVTAIEEHYRKQLITVGWKAEANGGDANIAFSRYTVPVAGSLRAGMLVVTPSQSGQLWVTIRVLESMTIPAPPAPKTESEMMAWMLRQLPRPMPDDPPVVPPPAAILAELLPPGFETSRIVTTGDRITVSGTLNKRAPSDLATFFAGLRKAGWSDPLRGQFTENFTTAEFCKGEKLASMVFYVQPKRLVMAGVSLTNAGNLIGSCRTRQSLGISAPIVVVPAQWSPAHVDGGGGGSHWRSGIRLTTSAPPASILADVESQIVATGFKATSRVSDANQTLVRFESAQDGSPAVVLLSLTKLPWSPQVDVVYDLVAGPKR